MRPLPHVICIKNAQVKMIDVLKKNLEPKMKGLKETENFLS